MTRARIELPAALGGGAIELDDERLAPFAARLDPAAEGLAVRLAYAAAHVVLDDGYAELGHGPEHPGRPEEIAEHIDWETTLGLRGRLDGLGFGIAEAMDTAQRFELGWPAAEALIRSCGELELANGFVAGASTDQLEGVGSRADLIEGVLEQVEIIQEAGGVPILLPMPWLSLQGTDEAGYVEVYGEIVDGAQGPLLVHWLGEMFHPDLRGYFPGRSFQRVMEHDPEKVRGAKLSLLDPAREVELRRELATRDQVLFSGDDFHFGELLLGEGPIESLVEFDGRPLALGDFSHGLLGVLDAVAEPAGLALALLAQGDREGFRQLIAPCEELGRWLFQEPTRHYKAGLAFLSWLNGLQPNAVLVNRADRERDAAHLVRSAELASACGAISDASLAAERLQAFLSACG